MATQEEIAYQQELLNTYRRRVGYNLRQQAISGQAVPFSLIEDIHQAREEIKRIKGILRDWGVDVKDHPDDDSGR